MIPIKLQAIQTALRGDWSNAVLLNEQILTENPDDIDALNRLAFALASIGHTKQSKQAYQKVLNLDTQNPIALKNLRRLSTIDVKKTKEPFSTTPMNNIFIEEPGKTKVIDLINIADHKATGKLRCGEILTLSVKRMKIFVLENQKQYVGMLPDDISKRLIKFMNGGNTYEAYVKTVNNHKLTVFIKETRRSPKLKDQPSFAQSEKPRLLLVNNKRQDKQNKKDIKIPEMEDEEAKVYPLEEEESF